MDHISYLLARVLHTCWRTYRMDQLANMGFDVSDVILRMHSNTIKWPSTAILQLIWTPPTMLQDIVGLATVSKL